MSVWNFDQMTEIGHILDLLKRSRMNNAKSTGTARSILVGLTCMARQDKAASGLLCRSYGGQHKLMQ